MAVAIGVAVTIVVVVTIGEIVGHADLALLPLRNGGGGVIVFRIFQNLGHADPALLRDESKGGKNEATPSEKKQHHNNTKSGKNTATPDESGNPRTTRTTIHTVTLLRDASKGSKKEATPSEKMRKVSNATTIAGAAKIQSPDETGARKPHIKQRRHNRKRACGRAGLQKRPNN